MLQTVNNNYVVALSPQTYYNLQRWANIYNKSISEAANEIILKFMENQDFYKPRKQLSYYTSKRKLGIIRVLAVGSANAGLVARKLGVSYERIKEILNDFLYEGIVTEKRYGRVRFFSLNRDNDLTQRLLTIANEWYNP